MSTALHAAAHADVSSAFPLVRTAHPVSEIERAAVLAAPGFGQYFTDHMASAVWTPEAGWHDRGVSALKPFSLHPGAAVLHYAQEIFEGLKAYRHADGSVWLFRPEVNARRFARSARRMGLPPLPEEDFLASVEALVRADEAWVPVSTGEESLYLRPFMFAAEISLGMRPSRSVQYCAIASPAQPFFGSVMRGLTLWVSTSYTRAARGGTGAAKCGGNYGASLAAQADAQRHGCDQVLYLDGAGEEGCIEESGAMNLFLVTSGGELITPAALGTILEGVTRDTVLALASEFGLKAVERPVTFAELREGIAEGTVTEVFAAGTAAVLTPVSGIKGEGYELRVGDGTSGQRTAALRARVLDIQYGRAEDPYGWMRRVV
ncbi:branched-chain amino acid aminotransferase [Streptomyces sp. NBC_01565]|uniref:branched-chain amino acid aminotransferase n=1 Tax=Streptomyces sp. NBC_01565 TaxID=2975881 RepID=UPI00225936EF|nr:branched-chain amino acid aminotransferase [Streptomyces sp. NBC_01565]MCX4539176.1 branched-chain amino acid aminotransferase [Streptomyces sp. NBC_01565]